MDADGSHAPEQLYRLLEAIDNGADLVIGSRYVEGGTVRDWPWRRLALSRTANGYARLLLGWRSTTSPRATAPTDAGCWRSWTSRRSTPRATASKWI